MSEIRKNAIIVGTAYPFRGGIANFNERLANEYLKNGYTVTIFTFTVQYPSFLFPGKTQLSDSMHPDNLIIHRKINSINPVNWIVFGLKLRKLNPDLLIVPFWIPFMGPCLGTICRIAKTKKTKIVSVIHNIIPHEKRIGDYYLAKYFVKSIDGFIAMSKSVLIDLEKFDKKKPKLFSPHPLYDNFGDIIDKNIAKKNLGLDETISYILFFGFIRDYKGLDLLLEAFADKKITESKIKLIVAGEFYSDSSKYLEIIERNNLKDKVILATDFIPDEKVANYFCASDIVVQPYKDATQSGVTQIAYHFNKPMIVTNVGGLPEIVPDNKVGYVVDVNPVSIAEAINKYYENNKETDFINEIKIEKEKYSWQKMIVNIKKLFENGK